MSRDDYRTPPELFEYLDSRFNFDTDVAASKSNALCKDYFTIQTDALINKWGKRNFCNPPYSGTNIYKFIRCAITQYTNYGNSTLLLLPVRTDQGWWHRLLYHQQATQVPIHFEWYDGRVWFINADTGKFDKQPRLQNVNVIIGFADVPREVSIDARKFRGDK